MMKSLILLFTFCLCTQVFAAPLKLNLKFTDWDYQYFNSKVKNAHFLYHKKNKDTKAIIARKITVLRPDEKLGSQKFLQRKCPKLSDKMKIELKIKENLCVQEFEVDGKTTTTYFFVTPRKTKKSNSFYWNSVSFLNTKKDKVNQKFIEKLRRELEKNNI